MLILGKVRVSKGLKKILVGWFECPNLRKINLGEISKAFLNTSLLFFLQPFIDVTIKSNFALL